MNKRYYGIKTPGTKRDESYIWWISNSEHNSWQMFFSFPNKNNQYNGSHGCAYDCIKAFESIGYKCVELNVTEMIEMIET